MDTPVLKDELNRKTLESIQKIAHEFSVGKITAAQYSYGVDILWNTVAGLVSEDFTQMAALMDNQKLDDSAHTHVFLSNDKGAVIKVTNFHNGIVQVASVVSATPSKPTKYDYREEPRAHEAAHQKFLSVVATLKQAGFRAL